MSNGLIFRRAFTAGCLAGVALGFGSARAQESPKRGGTLTATWGGGEPLTVDDVLFSITELWRKYAIAPAMRDLAGAEAADANTAIVRFSKPMPAQYFAAIISGMISY